MTLELLAPARNTDIGIAAIDCGADAVYIGGPMFGARKDAGNDISDIGRLCAYAHRFGARVFLTVNILLRDDELEQVHETMLEAQDAGIDAFIIRDIRICSWTDITVPLHASTQCAIRDAARAKLFEEAGCSRIILERELSLRTVREICSAVSCEVEFFVHGALCVCYSGECTLSEHICGRSADRGECIQACRSLYDLTDSEGNVIVRNKALLSLKDYNLHDRLEELCEAGISSFKIEGRLKSASYVRNIVRYYSLALDRIVASNPARYRRASHGHVEGGFEPREDKTFNRGYTSLFLDGKKGAWSSMEAPKSMGEMVGTVISARRKDGRSMEIGIRPCGKGLRLNNGDGFAFVSKSAVVGFRGDVCNGNTIQCKPVEGLREGITLFRNIDAAFEKEMEARPCRRLIRVRVSLQIHDGYVIKAVAESEDGRSVCLERTFGTEQASNTGRALEMLKGQISKKSGDYDFCLEDIRNDTSDGSLPFLSAAAINSVRRDLSALLDSEKCIPLPLQDRRKADGWKTPAITGTAEERHDFLMRSRYCVRYELGLCPSQGRAGKAEPLFLLNNGRRFRLVFDCRNCEMLLLEA